MGVLVRTADIKAVDLQPDRRVDCACQFLAEIIRVWEGDEGEVTNLLLDVTEASDASQVGRVHVETLRHSALTAEKDFHVRRRLVRFADVFGLLTAQQLESGEPVTIDFDAAVGSEAVFSVIRRRFKDDDGKACSAIQVGFLDIWTVDDPAGPDRSAWYHANVDEAAE